MTDASGTTTWGFDNADRLTSLSTPQGNLSYTLDDAGNRTAMTEPAGSWSYGYDSDNRLTSETNPNSESTSWTLDAAGRTTQQNFANGQIEVYGYDSRNRMTSLTHENSSLATISAETYTWDHAGNLGAKSVDTNSWSYTYDADDQLTQETAPSFTASYTYDANGNRASYTLGGTTQTYNVDNGDKLTSITSGGTTLKSYTYDTAGRTTGVTTSAGTTTLSYDYEDRITGITYPSTATNSFSYNGLDTRVGKTDSGGTFSYVRNGADVTDPVLGDGSATYTPGVSQHRSSATTFENLDYLGSSTRQTNSSQTTTATRSYDAFGNLVSTTGTPVGPLGFVGKAGYQEDSDSGLKLLGHRYYDPSTGRFLTRDPSKDGRNWYVYGANNPARYTDRSGLVHFPDPALAAFFMGYGYGYGAGAQSGQEKEKLQQSLDKVFGDLSGDQDAYDNWETIEEYGPKAWHIVCKVASGIWASLPRNGTSSNPTLPPIYGTVPGGPSGNRRWE